MELAPPLLHTYLVEGVQVALTHSVFDTSLQKRKKKLGNLQSIRSSYLKYILISYSDISLTLYSLFSSNPYEMKNCLRSKSLAIQFGVFYEYFRMAQMKRALKRDIRNPSRLHGDSFD